MIDAITPSAPPVVGSTTERHAAQTSPALRRAVGSTSAVLAFFALSNLVACSFLQGVHRQMPGAPTS